MKTLFLLTGLFIVSVFFNDTSAQQFQGNPGIQIKTRTVYVFVELMDTPAESATVKNYLEQFDGKVYEVTADANTQMLILEVKNIADQDIIEIIGQAGFTGHEKDELPPTGFKYVYNPDGTWKLKQL